MEMRMLAAGIGAALPGIKAGVNVVSGVWIEFRFTPRAKPYAFTIATPPKLGGRSGTLIASVVVTDWMKVDIEKHAWLCSRTALAGKTAIATLGGTTIFGGEVDVSLKIIDEYQETEFSMSKVGIKSTGFQFASISTTGIVRSNYDGALCEIP